MLTTFTTLFLVTLTIHTCIELWLARRHLRHIRAHQAAVPDIFRESISLQAHQKAADYTIAKLRLGLIEMAFSIAVLLAWTLAGGLNLLDTLWRASTDDPYLTGIAFILSFFLISSLLGLPFSLFRTFVIEQRFGFNRTTPVLFAMDRLKQILVLLLMGVPLLWAILWLMNAAGSAWWLYAWLLWTSFTLFMLWAYPTLIAPLFNTFHPLADESLKARIEKLLSRCGFVSKGLFVMDGSRRSSHGNAYFTGLGSAKRIVFFDTLIERLKPDETEAVLAHELGHFKLSHIRKRLFLSSAISLGGFALLAFLSAEIWFYQGLGVASPSPHAMLVLFLLAAPVFTFFLGPVSNQYSRRHEFEADRFASKFSNAESLAQALVKLYEDNASTLTPDPLYSAWHDSHPPATIRLAHLI